MLNYTKYCPQTLYRSQLQKQSINSFTCYSRYHRSNSVNPWFMVEFIGFCMYAGVFLSYVFNFSFYNPYLGFCREKRDFQEFQE